MKSKKININDNQKVLLFDLVVPNKKQSEVKGTFIMKMVYIVGTKTV